MDRFNAWLRLVRRCFSLGLCLLALVLLVSGGTAQDAPQGADPATDRPERPVPRVGHLVSIPLPITGAVANQVKRVVDQLLNELPKEGARPVLILEFQAKEGQTGEGSPFGDAWSLADYLTGDRLSRVRTVAYVPHSVTGHAVLVAMACEEIIVHPDAEFGAAGVDEPVVKETVRTAYREIAERRRTIPTPVALGMLDRQLAVYRAQTPEGVRYVLADELEKLQEEAAVGVTDTVVREGDLGRFSGRELRMVYHFASHLARDRDELAAALQLPAGAIEQDPSLGGKWQAVRVDLHGPINAKTVNWVLRSIDQRLRSSPVNFLCLWIESPGGSVEHSLRLAQFLAELDPSEIRTVAFVPREARADAALLAIACDHVVMGEKAVLGGPGAEALGPRQLGELQVPIQQLAEAKHRSWSLPLALVDSNLQLHRYTRDGTGEVRYLAREELEELPQSELWKRGAAIKTRDGLLGRQAQELQLVRFLASSYDELKQLYYLDEELDSVQPNWAHLLIERLASPQLAGALLFVAWFALMIEFMSPGLTVAGFISGVCFLLFFWANFLHGTAGWLEILLFLAGVTCVALELFVLPGVGAFGIGGGLLIISSIVLASQTFVIPRNAYQLEQLPISLFVMVAGGMGAFAAVLLMRRMLPQTPLFKRVMLATPSHEELEELSRREALTDFEHLLGKPGTSLTQLTPSGKVRIGDEVVSAISEGELIDRGTPIYVAEVRGNHVLVRPVNEG